MGTKYWNPSTTASYVEILVDKIQIVYFVEDRAQEGFIRALVDRVAREESFLPDHLHHDVRSARGGSKVVAEFKEFAIDWERGGQVMPDLVVVAIDGNCMGHSEKVRELLASVRETNPLRDRLAFAVPDPHIERWYLLDQRAFRAGVGGDPPELPDYKCQKDYYKGLLTKALRDSGIPSLLGGAEFGEGIVHNMDFTLIAGRNAGFARFLDDLRGLLKRLRLTT